ncbi:MAG: magnesium transporter [Alphaproteobacteria bacterium]|nr:magnesium transporter [Alphaproteobacteria bacterium]
MDQQNKPSRDHLDQLSSLYGMTPKVEAAVIIALADGDARRVRALVSPLHPADQADLVERLNGPQRKLLFAMMGPVLDPETLTYFDDDLLEDALGIIGAEGVAKALPELDSDDAIDILEEFDEEERDSILAAMPAAERLIVEEGLSYPEDSAGRLMQREVVVAPSHWTVGQTIDFMRSEDNLPEDFYAIVVIDPARRVLGQVRLSRLLSAQRPVRMSEMMENTPHQIPVSMDQEEVAVLFRRYALVSASVVDDQNRLVGMITVDDVVEVIDEEAEEDLMGLAGVSDVSIRSTLIETLQARFSWLGVNLLTAIAASVVISFFEDAIQRIVALAVLMPIVASMGGNAGTQTVTVAVRALALRQLSRSTMAGFIWREFSVGVINGTIFAITAGVIAFAWFGDLSVALVMGFAMMANLIVAGVSGTAIPLTLSRLGVDPAVASSVFITTITDVIGFLTFLGLAALFLL